MSVDLTTRIQDLILSMIDDMGVMENQALIHGWNHSSAQCLNLLINNKIVSEEVILDRIHKKLKNFGRGIYIHNQRIGDPEQTISPYALAYAIHYDEFTDQERSSISYGRGVAEDAFLDIYNKPKWNVIILRQLTQGD